MESRNYGAVENLEVQVEVEYAILLKLVKIYYLVENLK